MTGIPPLKAATEIAELGNKCAGLTQFLPKSYNQIGVECIDLIFKELSKDGSIPIADRVGIVCRIKQIIKYSKNQRNIIEIADKYLSECKKDSNNKIDSDWFDLFLEECQTISNEKIQEIWSNVLIEECLNPNSVRKSFLFALKTLDKDVAESFQSLNDCSIQFVDDKDNEIINKELYIIPNDFQKILSVENIMLLEESGLITLCDFGNYSYHFNTENIFIKYFDRKIKLTLPINDASNDYVFCHGKVSYTKNGKTLCNIIQNTKNDNFWIYLCDHLRDSEYNYEIIS